MVHLIVYPEKLTKELLPDNKLNVEVLHCSVPTPRPYLSGLRSHFEPARATTLEGSGDDLAEAVDLGAVLGTVGAISPVPGAKVSRLWSRQKRSVSLDVTSVRSSSRAKACGQRVMAESSSTD
jgi:hypothetical protein